MSILQPIYNELIVRMYSVLFLFENPVMSITQALFLIEHPHRFTSMVYGCSVGAPLGRLLMYRQRDLFFLNNLFFFKPFLITQFFYAIEMQVHPILLLFLECQ